MRTSIALIIASVGLAAFATPASAQMLEPSHHDRMERPIGFGPDRRDPTRPIGYTRRDENFNRVRVIGVNSLAAGNIISVNVEGSGNTVIVEADQDNSGDIENNTYLNGDINLTRDR